MLKYTPASLPPGKFSVYLPISLTFCPTLSCDVCFSSNAVSKGLGRVEAQAAALLVGAVTGEAVVGEERPDVSRRT